MAIATDVLDGTGIVAIGNFVVSKFQGSAFTDAAGDILADFRDASVVMLFPNEVLQVELRFAIATIEAQRLTVTTKVDAPIPEKARDIVLALLSQVAGDIRAIGFNRDVHFSAPDPQAYDRVGHTLFNRGWWEERLQDPKLLTLTVQASRNEGLPGHVNIKVEPSTEITPNGIYVQVNDHFDFSSALTPSETADFISAEWLRASERSNQILNRIKEIVK